MSSDAEPVIHPPFREWPKGVETKTYKGRCHCGRITFEYDHPLLEQSNITSCNCSWCSRTGALAIYGPSNSLRNTSPGGVEPAGFVTKIGVHQRFCPGCGCFVYWTGMGRSCANVRMFEGVDFDELTLTKFDGKNLLP